MGETRSIEQAASELNKYISEGRLVLFCGAGISAAFPTCLPLFSQYQQAIIAGMKNLLPETKQRMLENEINIVNTGLFPPELFMQLIFNYWGTKAIRLTDIFNSLQIKSNENHKIIASLARSRRIPIILTTNFDKFIEKEFGDENIGIEGYDAIQNLTSSIKSGRNFDKPMIVKLHGSAGNHKNIIVTLNQEGKPNLHVRDLIASLIEKNYVFLILGYSGKDFDLMPIILGSAKKIQEVYWTFYPPKYDAEKKTEDTLNGALENRFHSIKLDSTKLLWMLLPPEERRNFKSELPECHDVESKNRIEQIEKIISEQIQKVDVQRIYSIFAELTGYINKWAAAEKFLEAAWQANKDNQDNLGLALTAYEFLTVYRNQLAGNPSIELMTQIDYWRQQTRTYAGWTEDAFIKGGIAILNGIMIFEYMHDVPRAVEQFKKAEHCYSKIASEERREQIDQLIGQTYYNIGHCYKESCPAIATKILNDFNAKFEGNELDDFRAKMAIKKAVEKTVGSAVEYLVMAEERYRRVGALNDLAEVWMDLGGCFNILGLFDDTETYWHDAAMKKFEEALKIYEDINDLFGQAQAHMNMGETCNFLNKRDEKKEHLKKAEELFKRINFSSGVQKCKELSDKTLGISSFSFPSQLHFPFTGVDRRARMSSYNFTPQPIPTRLMSTASEDLFAPYGFLSFIPRFILCTLSGISSSWRFIFCALVCANLVLIGSWKLLLGCLIILGFNYGLCKKIGRYSIDIMLNLVALFSIAILTEDAHWPYTLHADYEVVYYVAIIIWGMIKGQKAVKILTYTRGLKLLEIGSKTERELFCSGDRNERLIFNLNSREAATFMHYFRRDPLVHVRRYLITPTDVRVEKGSEIIGKILSFCQILREEKFQQVLIIRVIRTGRNKFLIRVEDNAIDWYNAARRRYPDLL